MMHSFFSAVPGACLKQPGLVKDSDHSLFTDHYVGHPQFTNRGVVGKNNTEGCHYISIVNTVGNIASTEVSSLYLISSLKKNIEVILGRALAHCFFLKCLVLSQTLGIFQKTTEDSTSKHQCKATKATWELFWSYASVRAVPMIILITPKHWIAS